MPTQPSQRLWLNYPGSSHHYGIGGYAQAATRSNGPNRVQSEGKGDARLLHPFLRWLETDQSAECSGTRVDPRVRANRISHMPSAKQLHHRCRAPGTRATISDGRSVSAVSTDAGESETRPCWFRTITAPHASRRTTGVFRGIGGRINDTLEPARVWFARHIENVLDADIAPSERQGKMLLAIWHQLLSSIAGGRA